MSFRKKYTLEDDRKHDPLARGKIKDFFKSSPNLSVRDNEKTYNGKKCGIDLDLYDGDTFKRHIEAEIKNDYRWVSDEFPFGTVNFTDRKLDHLLSREFEYGENGLWVLGNRDFKQHLVVSLKDILAFYNKRVAEVGEEKALTIVANRVQREQQAHLAPEDRQPEYFLQLPLDIVHMNGLYNIKAVYEQPNASWA